MRKLGIALLLLLVAAGAGLWVGPGFVDWEAQRGRLEALASERLGRAVTLSGAIQLTLLPQPEIRAAGVAIGEAGTEFGFTARALRVRLDGPALLGGRLDPREVALVGPELRLPWPPGALLALRPPPWITSLDALIEDGRMLVGDTWIERINARLSTGGPMQALALQGSFAWGGRAGRFTASLGRAGWDGVAPFDLAIALPEAEAALRGVLTAESGFDGTLRLIGNDLSALLPSPAAAFRAEGRISATADLLAADDLAMEIGGVPARGAVAVRLAPVPRIDVAVIAARLEVDGWLAALRGAGPRTWPVAIDLSAETASFQGVTLRRLRGAAFVEEGRLTLSDVSAQLPGETQIDLAGVTAGDRLEVQARFAGADLRAAALAVGLPVGGTEARLLGRGQGRLRLVLEAEQAAIPEFSATLEGFRVSGAGVLRHGARPALGIGLAIDRLELDRWLPGGIEPADAARAFAHLDLNLRLAAEEVVQGALRLERAALDAAVEAGRLTVRRLSGRLGGADVTASLALALGPPWRLQDLNLEASGPAAGQLLALLPGDWPDGTSLAREAVALRLSGGGTATALALRGAAEWGTLRAEAQGTLDVTTGRGAAHVTLRHPGAPRLAQELFGQGAGDWLGEGSFSLVASLAGTPAALTAESFELVAGGLRMRGGLTLSRMGRPRLVGRLQAERLPLAFPGWRSAEPLPLGLLADVDADVALEVARLEIGGAVVTDLATQVTLAEGRLAAMNLVARLAGGRFEGSAGAEALAGAPPRLRLTGRLTGASLTERLFGLPHDLMAGRVEAELALQASGFAPNALLGSLGGTLKLDLAEAALGGFDLPAAAEASLQAEPRSAETAVRRALSAGTTPLTRAALAGRIEAGRLRIDMVDLLAEGGLAASATGEVDLARAALDLRLAWRAPATGAPEIGLRLTGPADTPRPLPETAAWARWRAEGR
jgi:uncharacterized protein involved in outer membrane biogenesis